MLAYRIFQGVDENVDPDKNLMVRLVRRFYPVTDDFREGHWFVFEDGRRWATPLFLCLTAIVFADLAFAIDSIPAAFAITRDPFLIWMGNVFALLGLRALFVLVEGLIARFRYLDETIAIVLGVVGVKLLTEDLVKVGPLASLGIIAVLFTGGIIASIIADKNDPDSERQARGARLAHRARARAGGERVAASSGQADDVPHGDLAVGQHVGAQAPATHQGAQGAGPAHSLEVSARFAQPSPGAHHPPTVKRAPTSRFKRIPRVTMFRRASSGARPSSASTSPSISVSARPPAGPGEKVPRPSA